MPNYIIKEERLTEFIGSLFKAIGKRKGKSIAKKLNTIKNTFVNGPSKCQL